MKIGWRWGVGIRIVSSVPVIAAMNSVWIGTSQDAKEDFMGFTCCSRLPVIRLHRYLPFQPRGPVSNFDNLKGKTYQTHLRQPLVLHMSNSTHCANLTIPLVHTSKALLSTRCSSNATSSGVPRTQSPITPMRLICFAPRLQHPFFGLILHFVPPKGAKAS